MNSLVATAILSIMLNPLVYRSAGPVEQYFKRHPRLWRLLNRRAARGHGLALPTGDEHSAAHRAVVVGYGPIGQLITRILREGGIEATVIELNLDTYRRLHSEGQSTIYGDATHAEVLQQAGIATAASMILSASGSAAATEAVRIAREANPKIHVVARADYLGETDLLRKAGANEVFTGEGEVALAMAGSILRQLGATPEQMDEDRERIRTKLIQTHS